MIFLNFKTYPQATGDNAIKLAIACEFVSEQTKIPVIPVVQIADVWRIKQHVNIPVWIQHLDYHKQGANTGFTTIESAIAAGAAGTVLNHSEHPIDQDTLQKTVGRIQSHTSEFAVIICASTLDRLAAAKDLQPEYLAYEPPELIGSTTTSVATEKAEIIAKAAQAIQPVPLIVGAGVKDANDIRISLQQGAKGILVASAVVKAPDPAEKLRELAEGFKTLKS